MVFFYRSEESVLCDVEDNGGMGGLGEICLSQLQVLPSPGQILGKGFNLGSPGKCFGQMPCPQAIFRGLISGGGADFRIFIING